MECVFGDTGDKRKRPLKISLTDFFKLLEEMRWVIGELEVHDLASVLQFLPSGQFHIKCHISFILLMTVCPLLWTMFNFSMSSRFVQTLKHKKLKETLKLALCYLATVFSVSRGITNFQTLHLMVGYLSCYYITCSSHLASGIATS